MSLPASSTDETTRTEPDDQIRCARCRADITTDTLAVRRGAHEHTFRNPAGYSWTIGCFRDAAGCASEGEFTAQATWFAGYEWCFASCATCDRHLGWWFTGVGPSFAGLIVSRLAR